MSEDMSEDVVRANKIIDLLWEDPEFAARAKASEQTCLKREFKQSSDFQNGASNQESKETRMKATSELNVMNY